MVLIDKELADSGEELSDCSTCFQGELDDPADPVPGKFILDSMLAFSGPVESDFPQEKRGTLCGGTGGKSRFGVGDSLGAVISDLIEQRNFYQGFLCLSCDDDEFVRLHVPSDRFHE